jgi:hypothetical protein
MIQTGTVYLSLSLVEALLSVALAVFARQYRSIPGARRFVRLQYVDAAWILASTVALVNPANQAGARLAWETASLTIPVLIPVFWVAFSFEYAGDGVSIGRRSLLALNVVPAVTVAGPLVPGLTDLVFVDWTLDAFATLSVVVSGAPGPSTGPHAIARLRSSLERSRRY